VTVIPVMIASPGDVLEERNLVRDILHEWNDIHSMASSLILLPVGWETHSSPDLAGRAQELINKRVLKKCDLLVGVFWTRIGTPTGESESGTVEEIRNHVEAGKPAMVYFSTAPVAPQSLDQDQYTQLTEFKNWCKTQGLIEIYDNLSEFSDKFRRNIQIMVRDNEYLKTAVDSDPSTPSQGIDSGDSSNSLLSSQRALPARAPFEFSEEAKKLLIEASKDKNGTILSLRHLGGQSIQTNSINFADSGDRRSVARWEAALEQLLNHDLIKARGHKNEIFELTKKGYDTADNLQGSNNP
jgi:hypothetical protein